MKADFFLNSCRKTIREVRFGLCDDDNKKPAYIDMAIPEKWIATVMNNDGKQIQFTAIDNCIDIFCENGEMDNRCDGMLQYDRNLLLIELKIKRADWKAEGLGQIESTLRKLIEDESDFYFSFNKRKAVIANGKRTKPSFQEYDTEQREYFRKEYKIHLQFNAVIVIR